MNATRSPLFLRALEPIYTVIALVMVAYHGMAVLWTFHNAMEHYTMHLGAILLLIALYTAIDRGGATKGGKRLAWFVFAGVMAACALISTVYLYAMAQELELNQPFITGFQYFIGLLLLIAVFGLNWVVWGTALTVVCLAAALYFGLGHLFPSPVAELKFSPEVVMSYLAGMGGPRGVYTFIPLSADTILLLLVYGGLMTSTLVLDMFEEIGKAIGNLLRGGVAYSCIAASSLVGMVTGQTVSCIALSGSMTIPTMIRGGFTKDQAGAIEVMAANGSQIIPPVMGLGAFLMAVILGISYVEVAAAAILPAFIYMITLAIAVYALVQASPQIPFERQAVDWQKILWILPSFLPSIALVVVLLSLRYSAGLAALVGIATIIGFSLLRPKKYRPSIKGIVLGLRNGALAGAQLAIILAAIGVIVQMLVTTGLGTLFSRLMIDLSGNSLEIALLLGMAITIFIGMGLPTPAAYSLAAIVVIPSLIDVGVDPLAAHFFGFYFAVFSAFTPPVAVGCLMAVRISGGSFRQTCIECFKLGGICLLLPFFMVAFPNSLQFPNFTGETLVATGLLCISTLMFSAAVYGGFMGRLKTGERIYLLSGPIAALLYYEWRNPWISMAPLVLLIGFWIYRRSKRRMMAKAVAALEIER
ncbi:MAG: C4-dicarboxylate ABC transporter [Burkholderiales bacterium]|nr:MAG: C4-dicarboxylate ABC transporter [Burkholderiales bacterium]